MRARRSSKALVTPMYVVHVGKRRVIVGFRYPESKMKPGEGNNVVRDGEVRVASHCLAVLAPLDGTKDGWIWFDRTAAAHIAKAIRGARVKALKVLEGKSEIGKERDMKKSKKKTIKQAARTSKVSKTTRGGPRKCSKCGKRGHNARSHLPGGLIGP